MKHIGITGPRWLTLNQAQNLAPQLEALMAGRYCHIGDAPGVDEVAQHVAQQHAQYFEIYRKRTDLPWRVRGAERATRMMKALAAVGGTLHAWPNKPAPYRLKPACNWPKYVEGSGTWGTVALAVGLGVPVRLHPLIMIKVPDWMAQDQLTLL